MVSASNEFQDKRKIRSLVFCQSQSQPSKTCWMPASLRLQLGPACMLKTWLYISITAVWMLLAHLLKVPIELRDKWSRGFEGSSAQFWPSSAVPGWALAGGEVVWGQEALGRAAHSAGSDLRSWAEAWGSFCCQPGACVGSAAGAGQGSTSPQKAF